MKKISKLLSGAMVMALAASMGITAFAAGPDAGDTDITSLNGNTEIDVNIGATMVEEDAAYSVNVAWQSMSFTYTDAAKTWSTDSHTWTGDGAWSAATSNITVINHSSEPVDVSAAYAPATPGEFVEDQAFKGVTVGFDDFAVKQLQAGDEDNIDGVTGDNMTTAQLSVSGTPTESFANAKVGTVTVTVSTGTYQG